MKTLRAVLMFILKDVIGELLYWVFFPVTFPASLLYGWWNLRRLTRLKERLEIEAVERALSQ